MSEKSLFKHDNQVAAKYKGADVLLNSPVETPDKETKYQVYSDNANGDIVSVRFNGEKTAFESEDTTTPAYWNKFVSGTKSLHFKHKPFFDMASKTIRSVRDGVQEYYGIELGMTPHDKVFTVYRSPETVAEIASKLDGLPITNDHVDVDSIDEVKQEDIIGTVKSSEVVEFNDEDTNSSLYLENPVALNNEAISLKDAGKKQFSLGYNGRLKPHDVYDFEQFAFEPTHLALVDSARGGSVLTFVDKKDGIMAGKKKPLNKIFLDAEGEPSLQQIVDMISNDLPDAVKLLSADQLAEASKTLQEVIGMAKAKEVGGDEKPMMDMETDYEDMDKEKKEKFSDSKLFKSIIASQNKQFKDGQVFKDAVAGAVDDAVKLHSSVIEKATPFLGEQYSFADKSTKQVMIDAIAIEHGATQFEDSELPTVFKCLKRSNSELEKFGDSKDESALLARIEKDLEGEA